MKNPLRHLDRLPATEIPAELVASCPRDVRATPAGAVLAVLSLAAIAGGLVLGVVLFLVAEHQHQVRMSLDRFGISAEAIIENLRVRQQKDPKFFVRYSFRAGSRVEQAELEVARAIYERLRVGDKLPIRYLESDPAVHQLPGYSSEPFPEWGAVVLGTFVSIGGVLLLWPLSRQRRFVSEGRAATAVVTDSKRIRGDAKKREVFRYEFKILSGALREGKSSAVQKAPAVGSQIVVLYDPENPKRNAPYPLLFARAAIR